MDCLQVSIAMIICIHKSLRNNHYCAKGVVSQTVVHLDMHTCTHTHVQTHVSEYMHVQSANLKADKFFFFKGVDACTHILYTHTQRALKMSQPLSVFEDGT